MCAGDGWTENGEMGGLKCVRRCLRVCDPVCENGMTDARSDGWTDRSIAKWMHGWTLIPAYMGTYQSS